MPDLEFWLLPLTLGGLLLGGCGILWGRSRDALQVRRGRLLSVASLLALGISGLAAAWQRAEGLAPLGLAAGAVLLGVLWDLPQQAVSVETGPPAEDF